MKLRAAIEAIEARRNSRVLVLADTHLRLDLLPALYDALLGLGPSPRLDVVFQCRGGEVTAARRIALLLHEFTDRLAFITPHYCQSAATIALLSAQEIVAGPLAIFSPIDPHLQSEEDGAGPHALSAEEIRLFGAMAEAWFGVDKAEAGVKALSILCDNIFPPTLTGFYRATLEIQAVCAELLTLSMPDAAVEARTRIADHLLFAHHSHGFPLTGADLAAAGLPVTRDSAIEASAWTLSRALAGAVGGGAQEGLEEPRLEALVATRDGWQGRRRSSQGQRSTWESGGVE